MSRQSIDVQIYKNQDRTGPVMVSVGVVFDQHSFGEDLRRAKHFKRHVQEFFRSFNKAPVLIPGKRKRA